MLSLGLLELVEELDEPLVLAPEPPPADWLNMPMVSPDSSIGV